MQIGLTGRMFLLVVIAVLPALAIQAVNEYTLRSSREDDIRERVIQITKQFGEEMKEVREGASQLLIALGELDEVQAHNGKECRAIFAKLKARFESYAYLGAADANGNVFCSSRSPGLTSIADTEFFKRAFSDNDLAVGNYFVDPISGEKLIHFAHVYRGADGTTGVVFAALDLGWLSEHLKERGLTPSQSILIADRLGNIIARLPHPEQLVGKNMRKSHEAIMDGDVAGWEEAKGVDGLTRIFGYVPAALPPKDFFLSAGQAKSEAFEPIDAATKRGILLILLGLVAATYLAWIGGRKFLQRPIAELLGVTGEWEKGNYDARVKIEDRCPRHSSCCAAAGGGTAPSSQCHARIAHRAADARIGGGEPRQIAVPGEDEPRDPHSGKRGARHAGAADPNQVRPDAAPLYRYRAALGRGVARDH
jgi:hypothetical protein